ncbi:hypothetical protein [Chiayiivirga flava]|uniref:DUF3379 domain-containing protein n=1 Tax=Chiayiivirga flava TaxID=659595 RepID=A0A7W8G1G4_9GAMM|nr:hypothetical protein [Chiayiivirga flava]MBB5208838.1 hypothetical protein [Chiayiivirga flava]
MSKTPFDDDLSLRRALRALPPERDPAHDLWPGIAGRLPPRAARTRRRWRMPLAFAAAAALALVAVLALRVAPLPSPAPRNDLVQREADAISREYTAAFAQFGPLPPPLQPAADELDRSAWAIQQALREQPDATFLLTRLRSTYDQRLRLSQRHALS